LRKKGRIPAAQPPLLLLLLLLLPPLLTAPCLSDHALLGSLLCRKTLPW
jgi:hypothetical protein